MSSSVRKRCCTALIFVAAFAQFSCSKNATDPSGLSPSIVPETGTTGSQTYNSYGLTGDGVTDNTAALQALFDQNSAIYLKAGTYIINQTINLKAGFQLYGEAGTVIKAGKAMSGTLLSNARYIFISSADNTLIHQITFAQSEQAYQLSSWNNACIYILNSKNSTVENSTFDYHLPYSITGFDAVWVSGTGSANTMIKNNLLTTLGIKYAENGADGTVVQNNIIKNPASNALTGNGNHATDYSTGCMVLNNTVQNAGRMGIEDWGKIDHSVISGNKINGTGKDPGQAAAGFGISAVGTNVTVSNNTISDTQVYTIEVRGNYNIVVSGNTLNSNPESTGIFMNYTYPVPELAASGTAGTITGNKISNSKIAIHIFGDYESNALLQSNVLTNIISKGISVESGSQNYRVDIRNNRLNFTVPATADRYALFSFTKFPAGTANQLITVSADTLSYSSGAAGGAGIDLGLVIRTDKAVISNSVISGSSAKSITGTAISAITAYGASPAGLQLTGNTVTGASVNLSGFTQVTASGNNF